MQTSLTLQQRQQLLGALALDPRNEQNFQSLIALGYSQEAISQIRELLQILSEIEEPWM